MFIAPNLLYNNIMLRNFTIDRHEQTRRDRPVLSFVRSESKVKSIWQYLKRYEDPAFVVQRIKTDYPNVEKSLRDKKAQHIADCIRQAEEYFKTASGSDLSIKPLILYYGMLDLVKAIMLLGDNRLTLEDNVLKSEGLNSHGLSHSVMPNTDDEAIRDNPDNLLGEFCYTKSAMTSNSVFSLLHQCWSSARLAKNTRIELGSLLSAHPATWQSYTEHTKKIPKYFKVKDGFRTTKNGYEHILLFDATFPFQAYNQKIGKAEENNAFLQQQMPRLASLYDNENISTPYGYVSKKIPNSLEEFQPAYRASTGESYTLADVIQSNPLHPIEIEFLTMFILGSLTRYAPQKWLKNVKYGGLGEMFVVEGAITSATVSFPKMILEELDNRDYVFTGDSSYFG